MLINTVFLAVTIGFYTKSRKKIKIFKKVLTFVFVYGIIYER